MALIDLSRFDVHTDPLTQDKQVFSDEGAGAYKAMASLGKDVSKIATQLYAQQMDVFSDGEALNAKEKFRLDTEKEKSWAAANIDPDTDLIHGTQQTYSEWMNDFVDHQAQILPDSLTETLSKNKFAPEMQRLGTTEKAEAVLVEAKETSKNTIIRGRKKYSEASDQIRNSDANSALNNLNIKLEESKEYIGGISKTGGYSLARQIQDEGDKALFSSAVESTLSNMALQQNSPAVLDFNLLLSPSLMFKDLGLMKKYVQETYSDLGVPDDEIDAMVEDETRLAAEDQNAPLRDAHPKANLATVAEKEQWYKRALEIKWMAKKQSGSGLDILVKDALAIPVDVGDPKKTIIGLERASAAMPAMMDLYNQYSPTSDKSIQWWADNLYHSNMMYTKFKHEMTPSLALGKGEDYGSKAHDENMLSLITAATDPVLKEYLINNQKSIGTDLRSKEKASEEAQARAIKGTIAYNPEKAKIMYGSQYLETLTKQAYLNGKINPVAMGRLSSAFANEFASAISPYNKDTTQNLMADITSKFYVSTRGILESNDPSKVSQALTPLLEMPPALASRMLTTMQSKGYLKQDAVDSIRVGIALKGARNQALYNRVIGDSQGANYKDIAETYLNPGANDERKTEYKNITGYARDAVSKFYKFSTDADSKESLIRNITNYALTEKSKNPSMKDEEFIISTAQQLLGDEKHNFNSSSVRGTIKRNATSEDTDKVLDGLEKKQSAFLSKMVNGTVEVDTSKIPGYVKHLGKYPQKETMAKQIMSKFFVKDNYEHSLETISDAGDSRYLYHFIRDRATNQKTMLVDKKGKPLTERAD